MAAGDGVDRTTDAKAGGDAPARRSNRNATYVTARKSEFTGIVTWRGDFRCFSNVGGGQETLNTYLEPGEAKIADREHALTVYWRVYALYRKKREAVASPRTLSTAPAAPAVIKALARRPGRNRLLPAAVPEMSRVHTTPTSPASVVVPVGMPAEITTLLGRLGHFLEAAETMTPTLTGTDLRLRQSAAAYLQRKRNLAARENGRDSTVDTDTTNFIAVFRLLGADTLLKDITVTLLEDFITTRVAEKARGSRKTISSATVRNELHSLSGMFTDLIRRGEYSLANPVARVIKPPPPRGGAAYLQLKELARLLDACAAIDAETDRARRGMALHKRALKSASRGRPRTDEEQAMIDESFVLYPVEARKEQWDRRFPHVEALVGTMVYSGGRLEEITGLCAQEIDLDVEMMHIQENEWRKLKTMDSSRSLRMPLEGIALLKHHQAKTGITKDLLFAGADGGMLGSLQTIFQRAAKLAQIERHISPKALRHTFTTAMLNTYTKGENGELVQRSCLLVAQMLGHTDSEMVRKTYGHLIWEAGMMESFSLNHLRARATDAPGSLTGGKLLASK